MNQQPQYTTPSPFRVYQKKSEGEPPEKKMKYAGGKIPIPSYTYNPSDIGVDKVQPLKEMPTTRLFPLGDKVYAVISYFNSSVVFNIRYYVDASDGSVKPSTPGATLWGSDIDFSLDLFPFMLAHPRQSGQETVSHPIGPGPMHIILGKDCGNWVFAIKKLYRTDKDHNYITSSSRGINLTLEQFSQLCDHLEEIKNTIAQFRKNQFSNTPTASTTDDQDILSVEKLCLATVATAIATNMPPDVDRADKSSIKDFVAYAIDEYTLSDLLSLCFDRNRCGLGGTKLSDVENVLKRMFKENGQSALAEILYNST